MLPVPLGGLCCQRSCREHETSACPAPLKPEQPPGQAGTGRGASPPAPRHTPAAVGYLAVSTQAGSCGRLGAKAGLPPGIVPRPQLGRISRDSSAEGEEMGRGSLRSGGVPGLGKHPAAARETRRLRPPRVRAVGAHGWASGAAGTWRVIAPRAGAAWHGQGWQAAAAMCAVLPPAWCALAATVPCLGLTGGTGMAERARLSQGDTRPPRHAVGCDGPPHPTQSAGIAHRAPLPQPARSRLRLAPSWDFPPFK